MAARKDKPATDLTPDQADAILRDPNAPGDVHAFVVQYYTVLRYLDSIEFHEDDNGVTHVRPAADTEGTAEEVPA